MKKRIVWGVLSCLMVAALLLSSCQPAEVEEKEETETVAGQVIEKAAPTVEEEEETTTVVEEKGPEMVLDSMGKLKEKPQYGGTVTFISSSGTPTQLLDPVNSTRSLPNAVHVYGRLGTADWSKGPQGTGEWPASSSYVADPFLMGDVVESWEIVDLATIHFKLRENVYWQSRPPMNGRQFVASDYQFSIERAWDDPRSTAYQAEDYVRDPTIPPFYTEHDKFNFTLVYEVPGTRMLHGVMNWMYMQPREVVEMYGDCEDPNHQVGTGPFMLEDAVTDSSLTWVRNPNYHHFDPFFPENRLPYIDKLQMIVIPDTATQLAALRTWKTDWQWVPSDKVEGMQQSNPELKMRMVQPDGSNTLWPRTDIAPFSDKRVRQAISMAIDQPAILEDYYEGRAFMLTWPVMPSFADHYTPLEELPESSQLLYGHNPEEAKKLLAEAGYPNGFVTDVQVSAADPRGIEVMSLVQSWLAEVGIEMTIDVVESTTFGNQLWVRSFPGMSYINWSNNGIDDAFGWANGGWVGLDGTRSVYAFANVIDDVAQATYEELIVTVDPAEQSRIRKEENVREIDLCWEIPIPTPAWFLFWTPCMKGYAGEVSVGPDPGENSGVLRYVWIDQNLKEEITGQRD
jgi:peptide/nickel transport system substrate-binding protein